MATALLLEVLVVGETLFLREEKSLSLEQMVVIVDYRIHILFVIICIICIYFYI